MTRRQVSPFINYKVYKSLYYQQSWRRADIWLSEAALPMAKRDLAKLGVTDHEQLDRPLPSGILIKGKLALRTDDNGNESNQLKRFEFVGVEPGDAFEPPPADQGKTSTEEVFPFGANAPPSTNGDHRPQRVKP